MIIFYNKKTGDIVGTIDGRVHSEAHLKMWAGDKKETERLVVQWKPVKERIKVKSEKIFEPDHKQKDLFSRIDRRQEKISNYRIDLKSKKLVRKKNLTKKNES